MITIYKPQIVQPSKFEFKVSFMYDDQNLETQLLPNTYKLAETKDAVRAVVDDYDQRRNSANLDKIQAFFTGDSVEL